MNPKIQIAFLVVVFSSVMFADSYSPPIGAAICAFLAYFWVTRLLKSWLVGLSDKFRRAPLRYPSYRRRKVVTYSSGYLLPWFLMLYKYLKKAEKLKPQRHRDISLNETSDHEEADFTFTESARNHCSNRKEPLASDEFKTFIRNISDHYIKSWYCHLSENENFPKEMEEVLEDAFSAALYRISRLNINQLANQLLTIVFNHLYNFKQPFQTRKINSVITNSTNPSLSHPAMRDQKSEIMYLMNVCEILVDMVIPSKILRCQLSKTTISDILLKQVLVPLVNLLTNPCWIMWSIAYLLGETDFDFATHSKEELEVSSNEEELLKRSSTGDVSNRDLKKNHSIRLSRSKSFSVDSLDDVGRGTLFKSNITDFGRSFQQLNVSSYNDGQQNAAKKPSINISATNAAPEPANEEYSPDFKPLPPYSLFPVLHPKAYKTLSNCKSVPSPVFDCLPKKRSQSKLKCSLSMNEINAFAESGLMPDDQHVFQNSPSAQNLCTGNSDDGGSLEKHDELPKLTGFASETPDVEEAEEVTEIMNMEPFQNVRIVGTKEQLDPRNKIYILYSIKYEYLKSEESEDGEIELVDKTGHAERRFKEFIALQSKLESPEFKKYMKGIEGPSKWLSMTISPKDKRNIEKRRLFLEKYLQTLCARDGIKNNLDLHEFLGFKGDPRIAFVKNASDFPVQRILSKMMGSAFDLIKTALPLVPDVLESGEVSPSSTSDKSPGSSRSLLPPFGKNKPKTKAPSIHLLFNRVSCLEEDIINYQKNNTTPSTPEDSRAQSPNSLSDYASGNIQSDLFSEGQPAWKRKAADLFMLCDPPVGPRVQGDGCDSSEQKSEKLVTEFRSIKFKNVQRTFQYDIPLANTLIDIVIIALLPLNPLSDDYATIAFKVLFGDLLQNWIQKQLNLLTKNEPWALCLHKLHETLWPTDPFTTQKQYEDLEACKLAALGALEEIVPGIIRRVVGKDILHENIEILLESLLSQSYNRNLLYQLLDVLIEMLCASELIGAVG